jgi:cephalosporin hydroxylase
MIEELKDTLIKGDHFLDHMNTTCAYYPILIYLFARISGARNILEVGVALGYGAYYFSRAAKDNGGMYYGIDIEQNFCDNARKNLDALELPNTIICADTKKMEKIDFTDRIDIAFLDGEHTTEAVMHEVDMIYPLLNKMGYGWIFIHDIVDMGNADAWWKLKQDTRFESISIHHNYGLGILRATEGAESFESLAKRFGVLK